MPSADRPPMSVVILTRDEEVNIGACLDSLVPWFNDIWVVDSGSTDRTLEIARAKGAQVVFHEWGGYPQQWNWALSELPFKHEVLCIFAADERATEDFVRATSAAVQDHPEVDLIFTKMKYIWMGRWIRHGGYFDSYRERIGRKGKYRFDERAVGEHAILTGPALYLDCAYLHEDRKPIADWIRKHVRYAELEATERLKPHEARSPSSLATGGKAQKLRWARDRVYLRLPPLVRPFLYFAYRYFWKLGFLDGWQGLSFHFLQGLWFQFLVDLFILEKRRAARQQPPASAAS